MFVMQQHSLKIHFCVASLNSFSKYPAIHYKTSSRRPFFCNSWWCQWWNWDNWHNVAMRFYFLVMFFNICEVKWRAWSYWLIWVVSSWKADEGAIAQLNSRNVSQWRHALKSTNKLCNLIESWHEWANRTQTRGIWHMVTLVIPREFE